MINPKVSRYLESTVPIRERQGKVGFSLAGTARRGEKRGKESTRDGPEGEVELGVTGGPYTLREQ